MNDCVGIEGLVGKLRSSRMADYSPCWILSTLDDCDLGEGEVVVERRGEVLFGRTKRDQRASCQADFGSFGGKGPVWLSKQGWTGNDRY